jgi:hypothetical protein
MATIFLMNQEIARGMVCFFHQKKHSYLIYKRLLLETRRLSAIFELHSNW